MKAADPKRRQKAILQAAVVGAAGGVYLVRHRSGTDGVSGGFWAGLHVPWLAYDTALTGFWPMLAAALAVFVAFSVYWEVAARDSAEATSTESTGSRAIHVGLTNLALLLEIVPIRGLGRFAPASAILMVAGLAVETGGLSIAIWARRHLGANWSGRISIKQEHELVRSGPYRLLRHPIYSGILTMYTGLVLVTGEWLALIGLALCGFAYWRKIRLEEAVLRTAFGPDYETYRRDTWAIVPGIF